MAKLTKKQNYISDMYVTYFGRVATKDEIDSFNDVKSLSEITAEVRVKAANESGLKGLDYLNSIIQNLFGRSEANAFESKYAKKLEDNVYYNLPIATIIKKGSKDDKGVYNTKKLVAQMVAAEGRSYELDNINQDNYLSIYNAKKGQLLVSTVDDLEAKISNVPDIINGETYMLTEEVNAGKKFTGTAKNDLFLATDAETQFSIADKLDGGKGIDTLRLIDSDNTIAGYTLAIPAAASIKNIEIIDIIGNAGVTANTSDTTAFAGVTHLYTTSAGANDSTAAATTNINATATAGKIDVNGGKDVTVVSKANVANDITVGGTTAAAGTVTTVINDGHVGTAATAAGATTTLGNTEITGGTKINASSKVEFTAAQITAAKTTTVLNQDDVVQGTVKVTGNASTTEVTVSQTAAQAKIGAALGVDGQIGITAGAVTINDANRTSLTDAGTITTVTLKNYGNSTINSGALTTVNLEGTAGTLGITAGALTTAKVDTLGLNLKGLSYVNAGTNNAITVDSDYKTLNVNSSTTASTVTALNTDAKTVNISGDAALTLTALNNTAGAANTADQTITVTNTAGVTISDVLDTTVTFTGGAGADSVALTISYTKAINMGAGDDVVTYAKAGAGGSLNGGAGNDTLIVAGGSAIAGLPEVSGFEILRAAGTGNSVGATNVEHNAHTFKALEVGNNGNNNTTIFTNVAAGVGLTVLASAATSAATTVNLANATGTADVFNLTLSNATAAAQAAGTVTIAGVETINITTVDAGAATAATVDTITLDAADATSIVVSGNNGLTFTAAGSSFAKVTNFDASAVVGNDTITIDTPANLAVTFASANNLFGSSVSIKGGAGNDVLTGTITANDTIIGGAGNDTLNYTGGKDILTGGAGDDTFVINNSASAVGITSYGVNTKVDYATITDLTKGDKIDVSDVTGTAAANGSLGAKVTLGAGATFDNYLDAAAAGNATATAILKWFQFENNTYLVVDDSAGTIFTDGADAVIKITGLVDLSTSTSTTDVITIA